MVAQYTDPNLVLVTMPGVVDGNGGNYAMHFNGQAPSQVQEGVDGVTEDTSVNQTNDMEFMQEMVAITSSASAEYSRAANFSLITHAGGNELHGRLLYSQVNDALNARNFFDPVKTQFRIHTLGANVGGPIRKNKTFFTPAGSLFWFHRIPSSMRTCRQLTCAVVTFHHCLARGLL